MITLTLTLPYPPSANTYWRSRVVGKVSMTYVSSEAKAYKLAVLKLCAAAGVLDPIEGRVAITVKLFPQRPQDWARRARKDPAGWDNDVRCIDLDNANKVLLDSLKGIAIEDDKWVRRLVSERMEPDGEARVVVTIEALARPRLPQASLLDEVPA